MRGPAKVHKWRCAHTAMPDTVWREAKETTTAEKCRVHSWLDKCKAKKASQKEVSRSERPKQDQEQEWRWKLSWYGASAGTAGQD